MSLLTGVGMRFATGDYDVVNRICALADRMGGNVEINYGSGFELEGVQVLPAPEPRQPGINAEPHPNPQFLAPLRFLRGPRLVVVDQVTFRASYLRKHEFVVSMVLG